MPQNTLDMFNDNYVNPVIAYICLRSVHRDGHFESPKLLSTHYIKTQFGIRLHVLTFIRTQYKIYMSHRPTAPQEMRAKHSKQGMTVLDSDEEDERTGAESRELPIKTILKEGLLDEGGDFME